MKPELQSYNAVFLFPHPGSVWFCIGFEFIPESSTAISTLPAAGLHTVVVSGASVVRILIAACLRAVARLLAQSNTSLNVLPKHVHIPFKCIKYSTAITPAMRFTNPITTDKKSHHSVSPPLR